MKRDCLSTDDREVPLKNDAHRRSGWSARYPGGVTAGGMGFSPTQASYAFPCLECAEVQVKVAIFLTARPGRRKPLSTAQRA